jgi:hypothetical protein
MKELEDQRPGRFGPNSKLSSGYSICRICFTLGTLLGPVVTGFMTRTLGYAYMSYSVGRLFSPFCSPNSVEVMLRVFFRDLFFCHGRSCGNLLRKKTNI